jgi:gliding motility-associated-like protein
VRASAAFVIFPFSKNLKMTRLLLFYCVVASFSLSAQTYTLQGDAQFIGDDCYQLTEEIGNQNGAVWYADQIDLNEPFDLEFYINLGDIDQNGADGICFVLQTVGNNALGDSGGGLGFLGFSPAFGVEFDTWQNSQYGDPTYDHIGLISNGDVSHIGPNSYSSPVQAAVGSINIEDGEDHIARIQWDPLLQEIRVFFDCEFRVSANVDLINQVFNGEDLVYWGFTAATGGSVNNQTVCLQENILTTSPDAFVCEGGSIELSVGGNPNGSFEWTPADFLDDPTSQTPVCTPDQDITYTVTAEDLCGNPISASIDITVAPLEVGIEGGGTITCDAPQLQLTGSSNLNGSTSWTWSTDDGNILGSSSTPIVSVDAAGTYTLEVNFENQCSEVAEIVIEENLSIPEFTLDLPPDPITCDNPETELIANVEDGLTGTWFFNAEPIEDANSVTVDQAGFYFFQVENPENGCIGEEGTAVNDLIAYPIATYSSPDTLTCLSPQVTFENSTFSPDNSTISWTTNSGNIIEGAQDLNPTVNAPGTYTLSVTDPSNGCTSELTLTVIADPQFDASVSELVMPNVFTPNNDAVNDRYHAGASGFSWQQLRELSQTYDLQVYNRWGAIVFETNGQAEAWDGSDNGNELAEGTYYFILNYDIQCIGRSQEPLTGTIQLKR